MNHTHGLRPTVHSPCANLLPGRLDELVYYWAVCTKSRDARDTATDDGRYGSQIQSVVDIRT